MQYIVDIIIVGGFLVVCVSFVMIRRVSHSPANGEVNKLIQFNAKIKFNKDTLNRQLRGTHHSQIS